MSRMVGVVWLACSVAAMAKSKPGPRPKLTLPERYSRTLEADGNLKEWWSLFGDAQLSSLVARAYERNPDLHLAQARLLESRHARQSARAGLFPSATPSFTFTNSQRSNNSPAIPRFTAPEGTPGGGDLIPRRYSIFDTAFDASYEFDWVGGRRKSYTATAADERAQQEDLRDTMVSVSAEVARNYFELREAQARRKLAQRNLTSLVESLELLRRRAGAGLSDEKDEARLLSQVASARANVPQLESTVEQAILAIGAMTGDAATVLASELGDGELPSFPGRQIPGGLPSELLQRRPDIRKLYAQLEAATLRRQSAETDWFPKVKLTTSNGGQSGDLLSLLSGSSLISSFAPKLSWGALNYKQTRANIQQKEALEAQQIASIEKTVATAFRDVESSLAKYFREQERLEELQASRGALSRVTEVSRKRFAAGLDTAIPLLEAERSELSAQDLEVQSQGVVRRNLVALFKALGGGW